MLVGPTDPGFGSNSRHRQRWSIHSNTEPQRQTMTDYERAYYEAENFWAGGALDDAGNRRRIEETAKLVPSDVKSVIDVGCGNGRFGSYLKRTRPALSILGIDRSEAALKYVTTDKAVGQITAIPVEDGSFDCLTCLEVIEHLATDAFPQAIREFLRVASRYIIVSVPYNERIDQNVTQCPQCMTIFNVDLHLQSFDEHRMKVLLPESQFSLRKVIFPGSKVKPVFIDFLKTWLSFRVKKPLSQFMSPICPLCGYNKDDVTPVSAGGDGQQPMIAARRSLARRAIAASFGAIRPIWPTYEAKGYWIACLYERNDAREAIR